MKSKKVLLGLVALAVVLAVMVGVYFATRPGTTEGAKTITVEVVHADGSSKTFTCHTDEAYLAQVLLDEQIVTGSVGDYGLVIESADGETASWEADAAYWALYINGEYATTGASGTPVNDGDVFKLEYTK